MNKFLSQLASMFRGKPVGRIADNQSVDQPAAPPRHPVQPFQPENELERMLMAAAGDPSKRVEFQQMLLKAKLSAATPDAPAASGSRTIKAGEQLRLLNVEGPAGVPIPAIFSSPARVAEVFGPGAGFIEMNGKTLLSIVAANGAFLNPGLAYGVRWGPDDMAAVLGRPVRRVIAKETRFLLGSPSQRPEALIAELQAALGSSPGITEAWLALAHWPENEASSWYLDVRTELAADDVNRLLADIFRRANFEGRPLDMVVNKPGGTDGVGIRIAPLQTH